MKNKKISFILIPLLLSYQTSFKFFTTDVLSMLEISKSQELKLNISLDDGMIIIPNDSRDNHKKKHLLEKRVIILEKQIQKQTDGNEDISLGHVLASMSGTILYGRKY